jgi:hypothetical protein
MHLLGMFLFCCQPVQSVLWFVLVATPVWQTNNTANLCAELCHDGFVPSADWTLDSPTVGSACAAVGGSTQRDSRLEHNLSADLPAAKPSDFVSTSVDPVSVAAAAAAAVGLALAPIPEDPWHQDVEEDEEEAPVAAESDPPPPETVTPAPRPIVASRSATHLAGLVGTMRLGFFFLLDLLYLFFRVSAYAFFFNIIIYKFCFLMYFLSTQVVNIRPTLAPVTVHLRVRPCRLLPGRRL